MAREDPLLSADGESLTVLHELAQVLELGVLIVDRSLVVTSCNRWLAAALPDAMPDLVGRSLLDVFPELRGSAAEHALLGALAGSTTVWAHRFHRYLLPLPPRPSGSEGRFERMQQSAHVMPLVRGGVIEGAVVIVQDVTERVAREEQLREALGRAEVASQAKSDFLASMSHELRTPLSAIIGYMDLLESDMVGPVAPLQKQYLGRVKSAAKHLIHIIEEILTFSRVEAGKEPLALEAIDVAAVAQSVVELFEPQATSKGLALIATLPTAPVMVFTDPTKLRQILINVVGNAMKFTDAGSVKIAVTHDADMVSFVIADTGPGMTEHDVERIFDPFTQLDQSLTRAKGGTGLGLPVSRKLAHLLGGDLVVDSVPGEGTTFTLSLPKVTDAERVLHPAQSTQALA
ncbi:MAG TPA: ATP-binding protein [Gemmatimonadaceae bacterium]|nr:ATP-binding protein [Gemmatimonadaceae bacterium]